MDMDKRIPGGSHRNLLYALMAGKLDDSPFPEKDMEDLRTEIRKILRHHGFDEGHPRPGDATQPTEVRLVQALLTAFRDPDAYFGNWWARGVWLGSPDRPLPRTPALYERKTRWPLKDDGETLHGDWKANYSSLRDHEEQVFRQYESEIAEGLMGRMSLGEALDEYGESLLLAATGAIAKKGNAPGGEVRVIYDGTNGVFLNYGIKIRYQITFPTAPDINVLLSDLYEEGAAVCSLLFDVSKAHRRVPALRED